MSFSAQNQALYDRLWAEAALAKLSFTAAMDRLIDAARAEGAPGAAEAFSALDVADRIIERACGLDVADEWNAVYSSVAKARSSEPLQAEGAPAAEGKVKYVPQFCDYCGAPPNASSASCAPPFTRQGHRWTGEHPADVLRMRKDRTGARQQ